MSRQVKVTLTLAIDDRDVAGYLVSVCEDDPVAWGLEVPKRLSEAVAGFLIDAIAPTPDPEIGDFFDRYHARDWLKAAAIDADFAKGEDQVAGRGRQ